MTDHEVQQPAGAAPVAHFPKQAIVVIHGMGEQMPMDTIKGFVRAAWETTTDLATTELPNPTEVWSANRLTGAAADHDATDHSDADFSRRCSIGLL